MSELRRRNSAQHGPAAAVLAALASVAALLLLAACTSAGASKQPDWKPAGSTAPIGLLTPTPAGGGSGSSASNGSTPQPGQSSSGAPTSSAQDPNVVATHLSAPTGLAVLPDGTALVGERTTGRLLIVQPVAGKPVKVVRTLTGLDTSGGGGLLDLALSASYDEDHLVLALITTKTDIRVVHFTLDGPLTPILTGIPRGTSDNIGRLFVQPEGYIYVGTGDAGSPTAAADPKSLAGKVLRIDDVGQPAPDNKSGTDVFTSGHQTVNGMCFDTAKGTLFETEARAGGDVLNILTDSSSYGWPGADTDGRAQTLSGLGGVGGCAVINNGIYIAALGGKDVYATTFDPSGRLTSQPTALLKGKYGRLLTIVAGSDNSLWITTSNKDGNGNPVPDDERVLHLTGVSPGGKSPA